MRETSGNAANGARLQPFRPADYIKITVFGFAVAALWGSLHGIILPVRLLDFASETTKNTYLSLLTFAGLVLAMAVQPVAGAISDRSTSSRGRRRPYILLGAALTILLLPGIGLAGSYAVIFAVYCLLQVFSNIAQGPFQALIPDLAPAGKRGVASGVKTLMEVLGGVALLYPVAFFMDHYSGGVTYWQWWALGALAVVLLATLLVTVLTVKERLGGGRTSPLRQTLAASFRINIGADGNFVRFLASRLLILMAFTTIQTFALYFLRDVVGVDSPAQATARFFLAAVAGILLVVYPAGRLSDRMGRRPLVFSAGLLGALGMALIFVFQNSYTVILICSGVIGISFGAFMSTNWALAIDLLPRNEEARYLGLTNLATAGGAALARLIGPVIDFYNGHSFGLGYQVMILACLLYFLLGSILVISVKAR